MSCMQTPSEHVPLRPIDAAVMQTTAILPCCTAFLPGDMCRFVSPHMHAETMQSKPVHLELQEHIHLHQL